MKTLSTYKTYLLMDTVLNINSRRNAEILIAKTLNKEIHTIKSTLFVHQWDISYLDFLVNYQKV